MMTFRSSGVGNLLTGFKPNTAKSRLTELQHKSYLDLCDKEINGSLTTAQEKKLNGFTEKINAENVLSVTAQNFIFETWLQKNKGFRENVSTKEMQKGIEAEDESLMLLSEVTERVLLKNQKHYKHENGMLSGTPDTLYNDVVIDVKSSWSPYTFMKADLKDLYEWQLRAYMILTDTHKAELTYCLVDMPVLQFADLERRAFWQAGIIDPASDEAMKITDQLTNNYVYSTNKQYTKEERIKTYKIERCKEKDALIFEALEKAVLFSESLTLNKKFNV